MIHHITKSLQNGKGYNFLRCVIVSKCPELIIMQTAKILWYFRNTKTTPSLVKLTHFEIFITLTMFMLPSIGAFLSATALAKPHTHQVTPFWGNTELTKFTECYDFTVNFTDCEIIMKLKNDFFLSHCPFMFYPVT